MKTTLILIGKTTNKTFATATEEYVARIGHYMPFEVKVVADAQRVQLSLSDVVVLLDERGEELRSIDFAAWLERKRTAGRHLVFIIGGPFGFPAELYARADEQLSLSRMTFSHQMVRLIFVEQLYRACTIIKGEGYHHE